MEPYQSTDTGYLIGVPVPPAVVGKVCECIFVEKGRMGADSWIDVGGAYHVCGVCLLPSRWTALIMDEEGHWWVPPNVNPFPHRIFNSCLDCR